jgi:hypothetical protein
MVMVVVVVVRGLGRAALRALLPSEVCSCLLY